MDKVHTCCFIGHRTVDVTEELKLRLYKIVEELIVNENIDTFLFGSKSRFNSLCLDVVSEIKEKHPHIKRIYVRAEYPYISDEYKNYLLENYEETYYPDRIKDSGRAVYVERNCEMIDNSRFCVFCYDKQCVPATRKSGTKMALDYAVKKEKEVLCL